jgi:large repetitive protein
MRRYGDMTNRRGRAAHVRPRPPSSGRPRQVIRAPAPATQRVRQHRGLDSRRGRLPVPARILLTLSVVALGAAVFLTASGGLGPVVASLGQSLDTAFGRLLVTSAPNASVAVATDAPSIAAPDRPATNQPTAALRITVPTAVINSSATVRIYLALQGLSPAPVEDLPVGSTTQVVATVNLTKGENDFTATFIRDGAESVESPIVSITLDQDPPKLAISSPKDNATVNSSTVTITGTTQADAALIAFNGANNASVTGQAGTDGKFTLGLPIEQGSNAIAVKATDPAGNDTSVTVTVTQGTGQMSAQLTGSIYRISVSHPPGSLQLRVYVTDPDGHPLAGASATFTLQIPGLGPITSTKMTDSSGRASFTTSLVGPMTIGSGLGTVLVTDPSFGTTTDRVALTFVK